MKHEHSLSIAKKAKGGVGCEQPNPEIEEWDHDELGVVASGISSIQMSQDGVERRSWNLSDVSWRSSSWRAYRCLKRWKKPCGACASLQTSSAMTWMVSSSQGWGCREACLFLKEGSQCDGDSQHLEKNPKKNSNHMQKEDR